MIVCLRAAAIASVMAVVASTSVMAQTTGTIPPNHHPTGSLLTTGADRKPVLVQRNNRRRTPFFR